MKSCAYCGRENDDEAVRCAECGTSEFSSNEPRADQTVPEKQRTEIQLREIVSNPLSLFRTLVVISTASYLLWFFQFYLFGQFISEETYNVLSWQGHGAIFALPASFIWLSMLLFVALAIGLWSFSRQARFVFTLLLAFLAFTGLFHGIATQTAVSSFLSYVSNLADGAILVMAYASPLKNKFV